MKPEDLLIGKTYGFSHNGKEVKLTHKRKERGNWYFHVYDEISNAHIDSYVFVEIGLGDIYELKLIESEEETQDDIYKELIKIFYEHNGGDKELKQIIKSKFTIKRKRE